MNPTSEIRAAQDDDWRPAARVFALFLAAGAVCIGSLTILVPQYAGNTAATTSASIGAAVLMGIGGVVCWRIPERIPRVVWDAAPVVGVLLIAGLNVGTSDATTGSQLFFLWPVLYAATFLRRPSSLSPLAWCVWPRRSSSSGSSR